MTLRLEPGTVLRFAFVDRDGDGVGDAGLHVLGRVEAVGTPGAPVVLTSAEPDPQPGDWQGLVFDNSHGNVFADCRFEYAQHALHAHFSSATLARCRLERNIEGTRLGNSRFEIAHCLVRGNESKGLNFFACANRIHHNLDHRQRGRRSSSSRPTPTPWSRRTTSSGTSATTSGSATSTRAARTVAGNWWGTTDPAAIRARVYDGEDDPALGRVEVVPAPAPFVTGWEGVR